MKAFNRLSEIDIARGGCVLLVVFSHLSQDAARYDDLTYWISVPSEVLAFVRMPLLMFISGTLASDLLITMDRNRILRRVRQSIWLLLIWTTILLLVTNRLSWVTLLSELLNPSSYLWFIWVLGAFTASILIMNRVDQTWLFAGSFALRIISQMPPMVIEFAAITQRLFFYSIFFYAGLMHWKILFEVVRRSQIQLLTIGLVAMVLLYSLIGPIQSVNAVLKSTGSILAVFVALAFFMLLTRVGLVHQIIGVWIGQRTLPIYLFHVVGMELIFRSTDTRTWWAYKVTNHHPVIGFGLIALTVLVLVLVSLAFKRACDRTGMHWLFQAPRFRLCCCPLKA